MNALEFRRRKWSLALAILTAGMVAGCLWCGVSGWILHRGYPYNTLLFFPTERFGDFRDLLTAARLPDPYTAKISVYFPFTYFFFRWAPPAGTFAMHTLRNLYWSANLCGVILLLGLSLRPLFRKQNKEPLFPERIRPYLAGFAFLCLLYPFWFCLDRGNIELLLVLLVGSSIYLLSRHRYGSGMACLVPAICFKLYPAVLLALYLRPGKIRWIAAGLIAAVALSWASLASFEGSSIANGRVLQQHLAEFDYLSVLHNWGLAATATLWNAYKVLLYLSTSLSGWDWHSIPARHALPENVLVFHQHIYSLVMLAGAVAVTGYVCLIETEFLRRVVLVILYMVMASPAGADYKLLHLGIALLALILTAEPRRHDLLIVGLLAFALIPKKELFLSFLGPTDSHYNDVSIGIFLTPLAMVAAGIFLVWDGWKNWNPRWGRQRLRNLLSLRPS